MKWKLEELKILARNPTVPGIALQDAISYIEDLKSDLKEISIANKHVRDTTLEYSAKWIENSLKGEKDERLIEFGKNIAMSIRASK